MTIQKLDDFAENGDKNLTGIDVQQGFVQAEKPARQWFNFLFNSITKKVNEVITAVETIVIGTANIADGAVTVAKLSPDFEITGDKIAKDADLDTPKLSATYALTTLDAPNLTLAADGTLKRSNDPLNASTRKVGTATGNLVERGADGYPVNNNAIGVGQTWQDVSTSRTIDISYTNTTGRPIVVSVSLQNTSSGSLTLGIRATVNGVTVADQSVYTNGPSFNCNASFIVPAGGVYQISKYGSHTVNTSYWSELR